MEKVNKNPVIWIAIYSLLLSVVLQYLGVTGKITSCIFSVILVFIIIFAYKIEQDDIKEFFTRLADKAPLDKYLTLTLLNDYINQEPWWTYVKNKIFLDLGNLKYIRIFCSLIHDFKDIDSSQRAEFVTYGRAKALEELQESTKKLGNELLPNGNDFGFLEALETCLATIPPTKAETDEVIQATLKENKIFREWVEKLSLKDRKHVVINWRKRRIINESNPWDKFWDKFWDFQQNQYL